MNLSPRFASPEQAGPSPARYVIRAHAGRIAGPFNDRLDLDDLDSVAGGYVFAADAAYEVIDNQGNVVESFGCDPDHTPSVFEPGRAQKRLRAIAA